MSETDSFIEEVSDEVRRDKLFGFFKKYLWVFIALVIFIVGGAAVNEYLKAKKETDAQIVGEALLAAQTAADAGAFAAIAADGGAPAILAKLDQAAVLAFDGQAGAAATILDGISADAEVLPLYRDLALLKTVMVNGQNMSAADLDSAFAGLTSEGAPFRLLAIEQRAIVNLRNGDTAATLSDLGEILADSNATQDLRNRAQELTISLGGEIVTPQSGG
ncbi:hypothetical protein A9Q96_12710 [Rhodobacterales bacterium 52_120_T64]|nr:hypothetical protein A9Q96_12710 [Rhodobacterales bacterium 52_120_T64]